MNGSRIQQPSFAYQNVGLNCYVTEITFTAMNQTTPDWLSSEEYQAGLTPVVFTVTVSLSQWTFCSS